MSARIFPAMNPRRNRYNYQSSNLNTLKVTCTLLNFLDRYRIILPYWKTTSFFEHSLNKLMKNNQEDIFKIAQNRAFMHLYNSNVYYELPVRYINWDHCPFPERNKTKN